MNDLFERINLKFELSIISKKICQDYELGEYISDELITVGYEDFNYILNASSGKCCVKIFHKDRTMDDCNSYMSRIKLSTEIGVNSPKVLSQNGNALYIYEKDGISFRLCVFEFIDGVSFFDLNIIPSEDDVKEIIRQMSLIHKAKLDAPFIYDTWTVINFKKEFDKKKQYLGLDDYELLSKYYEKYDDINFDKLLYSFIHGDITSANTLKDKKGKIWIIDWAVSNYLPRILDIIVCSYNLCLDVNSKQNTISKVKLIIGEYEKYNKLTDYEKEVFPLFFELANVMNILQTSYQKGIGNDSEENDFWLEMSRKGLEFSTRDFWNEIFA